MKKPNVAPRAEKRSTPNALAVGFFVWIFTAIAFVMVLVLFASRFPRVHPHRPKSGPEHYKMLWQPGAPASCMAVFPCDFYLCGREQGTQLDFASSSASITI